MARTYRTLDDHLKEKLAEQGGINRKHLYKALSEQGNPQLSTFSQILRALGYRIRLEEAEPGLHRV